MPIRLAAALVALVAMCPPGARAIPLDHLRTTDDIGPLKIPNRGVSHILVVPTRVGVQKFPPERWAELQAFFDPAGGPGTFRGHWKAVSGARYDPVPTLVEPVLYPDRCPVPGKTVEDCSIELTDVRLLTGGAVQAMFGELLGRVRDEQGLDLSYFDVNTAHGPGQDGYFDGVIVDTDVISGVAFPLDAFGASVTVPTTPRALPEPVDAGVTDAAPPIDAGAAEAGVADAAAGEAGPLDATPAEGGVLDAASEEAGAVDAAPDEAGRPDVAVADAGDPGPTLTLGNVALAPPYHHEFAHLFGFIDLYNGPTVNDLMGSSTRVTLGAFSRQQIGWGDVRVIEGPEVIDLEPVMSGGPILRVGEPPRYLLIENRAGPLHEEWDRSPPGIYLHSVDEEALPKNRLGFLDLGRGDLYLPNLEPPYLDVNLPLDCALFEGRTQKLCVLFRPGGSRPLVHASGEDSGWSLVVRETLRNGALRIEIVDRSSVPVDAGPPVSPPIVDAAPPEDAAPLADVGAEEGIEADGGGAGGCDCRATGGRAPLVLWCLPLFAALRKRSPSPSGPGTAARSPRRGRSRARARRRTARS